MKVGLVVMDENPADALRIVRAADRAGVHSLWTIDYYDEPDKQELEGPGEDQAGEDAGPRPGQAGVHEAFLTSKLIGLPGVLRVTSHLTMKRSRPTPDRARTWEDK